MELHRKGPAGGIVDSLAGAVVGVDVGNLPVLDGITVHGVSVVLAGNKSSASVHLPHGLVDAAVSEFQLIGASPGGQRGELMAETDAEQRDFSQQRLNLSDLEHVFPPDRRGRWRA